MAREIYSGTFFGTSMFTEFHDSTPIFYTFRNNEGESITVLASNLTVTDAPENGYYFFGTFFDTDIYLDFVDGEHERYIFTQTPQPQMETITTPLQTNHATIARQPLHSDVATRYAGLTASLTIFSFLIVLFLIMLVNFARMCINHKRKRNQKKAWDKTYARIIDKTKGDVTK
jgi:hypothetical protein